jgi:hypothetical protein
MPGDLEAPSSYKYVQQVGLSLYTFPEGFAKAGVQSFYEGIDQSVMSGTGDGKLTVNINNMVDVRERLKVMQDMMEVAHASPYYSRDESVLKIFMAPEFFFRGPHGAYDMRNFAGCPVEYLSNGTSDGALCDRPVMSILDALSESVKDEKWKDWMFVFGTIVSFVGHSKYYNFAPVLRGGPGDPIHHIVSKTFVSEIDFLDCPTGIGSHGGFCVPKPQDLSAGKYDVFSREQVQALARSGYHIHARNKFTMAGITFGLEVCVDHAQKELADHSHGVQVHLIVSAGMSIQWTVPKLPGASHGAPVFLQDGGAEGAHTQYFCPGCPYLNTQAFWMSGQNSSVFSFSASHIVQSPRPQTPFDLRKNNASRPDLQGRHFSTPPLKDFWYSPVGFGTEGTGLGVDPRFADVRINHVFADDDFKPTINIGPAFEVPVARYAAHQPQMRPLGQKPGFGRMWLAYDAGRPAAPIHHPPAAHPAHGNTLTHHRSTTDPCTCLKRWITTSHGSCDKGCCNANGGSPHGWCMTAGSCQGHSWKVCGKLERMIVN